MTEDRVLMVKTFNGESDSSGITYSCSGCGRPPQCKDQQSLRSRTDILISVFTPSRLYLQICQNILSKRFPTQFFSLTYI